MKVKQKQGSRLILLLHLAAWIFLFFVPIYLLSLENVPNILFVVRICVRTIIFALLFYFNYFVLIPQLLFKQKKIAYYVSSAFLIVALYFANVKIDSFILEKPKFKTQIEELNKLRKEYNKFIPKSTQQFDIYNYLFTSILITGFCIGLRMAGRYYENEKKRKELEKEMLNSELAFLKNQISPHFFFNTLNNIYSLIAINTTDAQMAILQLSKMMRYMLYESEHGNTKLNHEIEFMKNYVELMRLRLTEKVELNITFPTIFDDINIPPLLFIPFIENAFKYGISYRETSYINIKLETDKNKIQFTCKNSLVSDKDKEKGKKNDTGIGLENVKKRLNLLFPEKHSLNISRNDDSFSVDLVITVNK